MIRKLHSSFSYALAALVILMLLPGIGRGQIILTQDFNYADNSLLTDNGWVVTSAGINPIDVGASNGLTYAGYSGLTGITGVVTGNAARIDNNGEDDAKVFGTPVTSGIIYSAFLIKVTTGTSGYFLHLGGSASAFAARVFVKPATTGKINFGLSNTSTGVYAATPTSFDIGTTYLIILKYDVSTTGAVSMWVISSGIPVSEAAAGPAEVSTSGTGQASIDRFCFRQYATTQSMEIDGIRVGPSWAVVLPVALVAPTTQATNISFSSVASTSFTASWTNGNGANRAVFVKQANTGSAAPADNATYTASTTFGSGTQIGSTGWYCVYNGTGSTIGITGLTASTEYIVHVCEYNGTAGSELYNITSGTNNPLTQTTSAGAIAPSISSPTVTAITLTSATLGGNITSDGGSAITERGTVWSLTSPVTIADNKVAEGNTTAGIFTQNRASLPSGTLIHYAAYATNIIGTTLSTESSFTTLFAEPANHVTAFAAGTATSSTVSLTWTDATGGVIPAGYLISWNTSGIFTDPVDGTAQANASGFQNIAQGVQTYTVTGLTGSTPYYFKIWPYTNSGTDINYKTDGTVPTANATTLSAPTAVVISRPSYIDLASTTSESAVLMTLSNYSVDDARYRLYNGSNQYNCWEEATGAYITSTSYGSGPQVPGTPTTSSTFWILSQRGNNNTTVASYRDRLNPYSANYQTAALPAATSITTPFTLAGTFVGNISYDNSVKHVVLAYNGATLVSAATTTLSSGLFSVVCPDGTTIDKIEIRAIDNTLIETLTGSWAASTDVGNIPNLSTTFTAVSGNWSASGNWSNGIPTSTIDAIVDGDVTIDAAAETKALTINSGKSVTISDTKSLTVNGMLTNSAGTSGLVVNSGGSLIQNTQNVKAIVKIAIPGGGETGFHLLALPIMEGIASAAPFFDLAYLDKYSENSGAWVRLMDTDPVTADQGYSINYATTQTLSFEGTLFDGNQIIPVSYSGGAGGYGPGWNLLGNPFPAALDMNSTGWDAQYLDNYAYVWNGSNYLVGPTVPPDANGYTYGTLPGNLVPAMQGFFVHATALNASLTIPAEARTVSNQPFYKSSGTAKDALFLTIDGNGYQDKAIVAFNPSATANFDGQYDAYKLFGIVEAPQLYSIIPGQKATVNTLPDYIANPNVSLGLKVGASATYTLNVSGIESFDAALPVRLDDLKTGISQDLRLNPVYTFTAAPGDAENRFLLSLASVTAVNEQNAAGIRVVAEKGIISVTHNATVTGSVYLYTASGQLLATSKLNAGETNLPAIATGVYIVKVVTGKTSLTRKMVVVQ